VSRRSASPDGPGLFARILKGWLALFRGVGGFLFLAAASAALAALIALPLWAASTGSPRVYSIVVLALAAAGAVFAAVRASRRARRAPRDPSRPRRTAGTVLFAVAKAVLLACGLYGVLFLCFRGLWIPAVPAAAAWLLLAGWAAFGGARGKVRKVPLSPADNGGE
jgi:hypothetical protein